MAVTFNTREVSGVTVIDVSGRITLGESNMALREQVNKAIDAGSKSILLNLAELNYMDSSGVGTLVGCYTSAQNRNAKLKLLNLTKKMTELLAITKLLTVFDTFDDEQKAVSSF
jgi:anti-sigma B factor antagonist